MKVLIPIHWMRGVCGFLVMLTMASCGHSEKLPTLHGQFHLAVDESMQPVIEECLRVYKAQYPDVEVNLMYMPESEVMSHFANKMATVAISARVPDSLELINFYKERIGVESYPIAEESIHLVANANQQEISEFIMFPHQGDSYLRMIPDSIRKSKCIVEKTPYRELEQILLLQPRYRAVVGAAWKPSGGTTLSFSKKIKFDEVDSTLPQKRIWFAINGEPRLGPASGFVAFLRGVRGQKIIAKTNVSPAIPAKRLVHLKGSDLVFAPESLTP